MNNREVSFTSLCYITEDYDGRIWLNRLADVENNTLVWPAQSDRQDNYFENRERLYRNDGPSDIGAIGIWHWSAIPNKENPAIDYVQSYYAFDLKPTRVVVSTASSMDDLLMQLKEGLVYTKPYFCDTLFCFSISWQKFRGFLCKAEDFDISDRKARLKPSVYALPQYTIHTEDIYNWDDKHLRFLRNLELPEVEEYYSVGNAYEIIKSIVLERATWPLFKECVGATKADWRRSKVLLEKICEPSLIDVIANSLKCTTEQAKQSLDDFLLHSSAIIDAGDFDVEVLARIALAHEELLSKCEEAVSSKWKEAHADEVQCAEEELVAVKNKIVQEEQAAQTRLSKAEQAISAAEKGRNELLQEISAAQLRLDQILSEIERNDALANETVAAIRSKIAEAQTDMAKFIADLSVFLPQAPTEESHSSHSSSWKYESAPAVLYAEDDIDLAESWQNEFDAIHQNISHALSVDPELGIMLTAYLYSTHINNVPILIAGPGGPELADALSVSIYAKSAGHLIFGTESNLSIADGISDHSDTIVCTQNMFGKGWVDAIPQSFSGLEKHIIWTHPYVEDLLVEPRGLYNYMLPILSECFIGAIPALDTWPGKREKHFKPYTSAKKEPLRLSAFKQLKLSKLLTNQLTLVLSDAKAILESPAKEKDMEILFGLLPLCVLTGRTDILADVIENEDGISAPVKAEVRRYIEEV